MRTRTSCRWGGRVPAVAVALVLLVAACDFTVGTETGRLDPDFGEGDGATIVGGLRIRTPDSMSSAARLPNGRVVAVDTEAQADRAITRFRRDGTLDRTFGEDGVAGAPLRPMGEIAVTADGKILVPGRVRETNVWGVARLLPTGAPDPGFGIGGVAVLDIPGERRGVSRLVGIATAGDRTYLLALASAEEGVETVVLALGPDGAPDPEFGPDGTGVLRIGGGDRSTAMAVAPDGGLVVPSAQAAPQTVAEVVRVSPAGDVVARLDLATVGTPTPLRVVDDVDVGPDGSVALLLEDSYGRPTSYLLRVTPDLALDTSFGDGGVVDLRQSRLAWLTDVLADDPAGRVLVVGQHQETRDFVAAALAADGSLDAGWGDGGVATLAPAATPTNAAGVFATTGGGVLIAGQTSLSGQDPRDQFLLALTPTGHPDPAFGDGGWARTDLGQEAREIFTAVAALPGGDVLVAGETGDGVLAGRYDADGTPDGDRPPAPLLPDRLRGHHNVVDIAVAADGSAHLLVQYGLDKINGPFSVSGPVGWRVVKLDADGRPDPAFGDGGVGPISGGWTKIATSIALRADGTVLVSDFEYVPDHFIPPRQSFPARFTDRIVALTPAGAPADATWIHSTGQGRAIPGRTLAVGAGDHAYVVADGQVRRMAPDGTVSTWAPLPDGTTLAALDLAIDAAGRVLVYGTGGPTGALLARFDAALALDTTFGTRGLVPLAAPELSTNPYYSYSRDLHVDADGRLTVMHQGSVLHQGAESYEPDLLVHRLLPSGQPDPSFSGDGRAEGALHLDDEAAWVYASAVVGRDVVLVGRASSGAFAARVNG